MQTERLVLRPPEERDVARLAELANEYDVARFTTLPHPYSEDDARAFVASSRKKRVSRIASDWAITLDDGFIGMISLMHIEQRRAELGYWLGKPYWGNGYMTEAVERVVRYGFEELDLARVWATVMATNAGSIRILENAGFVREGTMRRHEERFGDRHDMHVYGLLCNQRA